MDGHRYTALFECPNGIPVLHAYPDPLTGHFPFTIGVGHVGPDVTEHTVWTEAQCWHAFYNDYAQSQASAASVIGASCWSALSDPRKAVLTDMAFQMGSHGVAKFRYMLEAIRNSHWIEAKIHLLDSEYAKQTPNRAVKNAAVLESGEWPEDSPQGALTS